MPEKSKSEHYTNQIERIRATSSKTRLSIMFYSISGNCVMMAKQTVKLLEIFNEAFPLDDPHKACHQHVN